MKVFVPQTDLLPVTRQFCDETAALYPQEFTIEHVALDRRNRWAYVEFFEQRWAENEPFISLEHDVVPWPGALHGLKECGQPWCFYNYVHDIDGAANGGAVFGLMRMLPWVFLSVPKVWDALRAELATAPQPWRYCDMFFFRYATARGLRPHQHHPAVFHAHPPDVPPSCEPRPEQP